MSRLFDQCDQSIVVKVDSELSIVVKVDPEKQEQMIRNEHL